MMKKKMIFCHIVLCMFLFSGCVISADYDFLQETKQISSIEIVQVEEREEERFFSVICIVQDRERFLEDFSKLDCYRYYSDPGGIEMDTTVIKISYENGEYELIGPDGSAEYTHKYKFRNYAGHRYFEDEEFSSLIEKYSS